MPIGLPFKPSSLLMHRRILMRGFATQAFQVNGHRYCIPEHGQHVVGICVDGCCPEYLKAAKFHMPNLNRKILAESKGHMKIVRSAMPTLTNPNNMSIVTGVPPAIHGISGNYYFDVNTQKEVMMTGPELLRCPTIFPEFLKVPDTVVVILTVKHKVFTETPRDLLSPRWIQQLLVRFTNGKIASFSDLSNEWREVPSVYSAESSLFMLDLGIGLLDFLAYTQPEKRVLAYFSTTDFIQHKYAPFDYEAMMFYKALDERLGALHERGVVIGVTADHGMSDKTDPSIAQEPNVVYIESELAAHGIVGGRCILPITDPYVRHHGALGGYAIVYVPPESVERSFGILEDLGKYDDAPFMVYRREDAAELFELPVDRIGDLILDGGPSTVLGRTPEYHDLSQVGVCRVEAREFLSFHVLGSEVALAWL
ncbi:conserved hypothetical protein [Perkinsus marinus ATCC 50983]|uniref:Phosphonoacetate hydrolase n=1 Tax=Perkinsus marinus (strain ATCC 50983 / TXsc) TaxID=423536 RepID=C5KH64_PERM5|nr:conserved hypothetical protein [Perkinsus marinus ATCC 50983]EER15926.1 conserved hypothetical protein [Perkinsus marinus ATCC 50983]|eukprot:XP_002784130.1 conserved hypothetical protein [Perkinsus marinus ATCC 50983]